MLAVAGGGLVAPLPSRSSGTRWLLDGFTAQKQTIMIKQTIKKKKKFEALPIFRWSTSNNIMEDDNLYKI